MIATWMLSALLFTALLGAAAFCAESALRAAGRPTRWPWLVALVASVVWPVCAPFARRSDALQSVAITLPTIQVVPDQLPATMPWTQWIDVVLLTLWAVSSMIVLVRLVHALVVLARVRRASEPRMVDGVPVLVSASAGPAVIGVIQPRVMLPLALLDLEAPLRRLVLRHEQEHCRARDPWIVVGSAFALAVVPWNLPLWWIARRVRLAIEVDCDARVLATEPNATRYGQLLLLIAQRERITMFAPMLAASSSHLEQRIAAMLPIRSNRRRSKIAVALVASVVAGIAACTSRISGGSAGPTPVVTSNSSDVNLDQTYFEFQVTKQVQQIPGTGNIRYPEALRAANVQGEILAQFVVDASGQFVPGSFQMLRSSHDLFTQAVSSALPTMKFSPAEVRGTKVKQLVQQPFTFSLTPSADAPGTLPVNPDQPYFEFQVTKSARQIPGSGRLHYPDELRSANIQGEVLAQFVVDENGRYEANSFKVLRSSHALFTQAARDAVTDIRFIPAEYQGKRVKQLVQQPFTFSLSKQ